jgi:bisphosphoglycerate-independent phosphoglycerate mutase (AlkP superfamily)
MKRLALFVLLLATACGGEGAVKSKHVLLIGIDGVRVDALQQADTPSLDGLIEMGTVTYDAFAGGVLGTPSEQMTWSGPGWSSILTGVWVDKHGVEINVFDEARFDEYPHFFARVRQVEPEAYLSSFVTWAPINESIAAPSEPDEMFSPANAVDSAQGDQAVTAAVVAHLAAETPMVVFVQLDEVDHQGHAAGFSPTVPEYIHAIEVVDFQIGQMLAVVQARPTIDQEDWLFLVTTDHGGAGQWHGMQSDEERTIFIIASGGSLPGGRIVSPGPGQTAIAPTVLAHLRIPVDEAWGWESKAFAF